jgi:hypothetical protein
MNYRLVVPFLATIGLGIAGAQTCQTIEVPVTPISATGHTFRGLNAQDFVLPKGSGQVKSLTFDDGPRRVLVVVDTSSKLSNNTRRAEAALLESLVAAGRPEDSLALIAARGPGGAVKFGEDRAGITAALNGADKRRSKEGVLDAAMEGMEWFAEPRPGDAIVLVAADLDGNHKTNAKAVAKALSEHHIRMFGLALGPVTARSTVAGGSMTSTTSQGFAWTTPVTGAMSYETGDENFFPLTVNSGGAVLPVVNGSDAQSYNMENAATQTLVKQRAQQILSMIASFYRMQIESREPAHSQMWKLDVTDGVKKAAQKIWLLYPQELGPC